MAISAIMLSESKGVTSSVILRLSNCSLEVLNGVAHQFHSANRQTSLLFKSPIQSDHLSMTLPQLSIRSAKLTKFLEYERMVPPFKNAQYKQKFVSTTQLNINLLYSIHRQLPHVKMQKFVKQLQLQKEETPIISIYYQSTTSATMHPE